MERKEKHLETEEMKLVVALEKKKGIEQDVQAMMKVAGQPNFQFHYDHY